MQFLYDMYYHWQSFWGGGEASPLPPPVDRTLATCDLTDNSERPDRIFDFKLDIPLFCKTDTNFGPVCNSEQPYVMAN